MDAVIGIDLWSQEDGCQPCSTTFGGDGKVGVLLGECPVRL